MAFHKLRKNVFFRVISQHLVDTIGSALKKLSKKYLWVMVTNDPEKWVIEFLSSIY